MTDLNEARIEVVRRHMALEITHDWDGSSRPSTIHAMN